MVANIFQINSRFKSNAFKHMYLEKSTKWRVSQWSLETIHDVKTVSIACCK